MGCILVHWDGEWRAEEDESEEVCGPDRPSRNALQTHRIQTPVNPAYWSMIKRHLSRMSAEIYGNSGLSAEHCFISVLL